MDATFRAPTDLELAFLRIVTRGYETLAAQVESCAISDYDETGYYDVRVLDGEPMAPVPTGPIMGPLLDLSGSDASQPALVQIGEQAERVPYVLPDDPKIVAIDILLWTDDRGFLSSVEVCSYGDGFVMDPCAIFIDEFAARSARLQFRTPP